MGHGELAGVGGLGGGRRGEAADGLAPVEGPGAVREEALGIGEEEGPAQDLVDVLHGDDLHRPQDLGGDVPKVLAVVLGDDDGAQVPAHRAVRFTVGKALKDAVNA